MQEFLAALKTYWWPSAVVCSMVGLLSLWHIPHFHSQFYCTYSLQNANPTFNPSDNQKQHAFMRIFWILFQEIHILRFIRIPLYTCKWENFILNLFANILNFIRQYFVVYKMTTPHLIHPTITNSIIWSSYIIYIVPILISLSEIISTDHIKPCFNFLAYWW